MSSLPPTEAAQSADFCRIKYAQVWEDADVLMEALDIRENSICVSIASAGDNALAMLSKNPAKVYAVDLNPAQIHCLNLRIAAFKNLSHQALLELIGSRSSDRRIELYHQCRPSLPASTRLFWDQAPHFVKAGIGNAGKFEHYFAVFRKYVLPMMHRKERVMRLLRPGDQQERMRFYEQEWNNRRMRLLLRLFFSRPIMQKLGRDPAFFKYVKEDMGNHIQERLRHACTILQPDRNPYLQWILTGRHHTALPYYLREEHFDTIRDNIGRLEVRACTLEELAESLDPRSVNAFNLSDVFEYMSESNSEAVMKKLLRISSNGCRYAYWNMLVPRRRPDSLRDKLVSLDELGNKLFKKDKAFFYSRFVVEEVVA